MEMQAKYRDKTFSIPGMWWAVTSRRYPELSPIEIIRWWAWQDDMEEHGTLPPDDY